MAEAFYVFFEIRFKENGFSGHFVDDTDITKAEEKKEQLKETLIKEGWKPEDIYISILPLDKNQCEMFRGFRK